MYFTRITYNNNNWVSPSGTEGKSNNMSLFEAQSHFGFEEWTFDLTKIVEWFSLWIFTRISKSKYTRTPREPAN
jgi:hypothetical protein